MEMARTELFTMAAKLIFMNQIYLEFMITTVIAKGLITYTCSNNMLHCNFSINLIKIITKISAQQKQLCLG